MSKLRSFSGAAIAGPHSFADHLTNRRAVSANIINHICRSVIPIVPLIDILKHFDSSAPRAAPEYYLWCPRISRRQAAAASSPAAPDHGSINITCNPSAGPRGASTHLPDVILSPFVQFIPPFFSSIVYFLFVIQPKFMHILHAFDFECIALNTYEALFFLRYKEI